MIVFITSYDDVTQSNLEIAKNLHYPYPSRFLLAQYATKDNLQDYIREEPNSIFAMSHGLSTGFRDQERQFAICTKNEGCLSNRKWFVFACHTATSLGQVAAKKGSIWWGYTGAIAPPDENSFMSVFVRIFNYILSQFNEISSAHNCYVFFEQLKGMCEDASEEVSESYFTKPEADTHNSLLCLKHIWARLRVWLPSNDEPLRHPQAPDPLIDLDDSWN